MMIGRQSAPRRRGIIVLELIVALPILVIFLLAVVEFGLILALTKHVSFASRFGAKIAAETPSANLGAVNSSPDSPPLFAQIQQQLNDAGVTGPCQVILEDDVTGIIRIQDFDPGSCGCNPPSLPLPSPVTFNNAVISDATSVRVTVVVPIVENIPDLLCTFGFSIADRNMIRTTVYRFEDCMPSSAAPGTGGGGTGGGSGGNNNGNGNNGNGNNGNGNNGNNGNGNNGGQGN